MIKTYLLDYNGIKHHTDTLPWNSNALINDLGLKPILNIMASGDEFLLKNSTAFLLNSADSIDEIIYRQEILKDFIENNEIALKIYEIASSFLKEAQKQFFWFSNNESLSMQISIDVLKLFAKQMDQIREIMSIISKKIKSRGLKKFNHVVTEVFHSEYMQEILNNLERLQFKDGITLSVSLGMGNEGKDYILHKPGVKKKNIKKIMGETIEQHYTYTLADRDISGGEEIVDIRNRGIRSAAMALKKSAENSMKFFKDLRCEIGFYLASLNLLEEIKKRSGRYCFPEPLEIGTDKLRFNGLYELGLMLATKSTVVPNNIDGGDKRLFVITGTNRGGKSTFLRSIGQAQLLMQCGMFVPAESFISSIVTGIFTHFKHEEDITMERGKFDDELSMMNDIAAYIRKNGMLLFNESFSSTNTREGSEIAMQITNALLENGIRIFFVSHLYEFASAMMDQNDTSSMFLIAERTNAGEHTYKIIQGSPSVTGHGMDLYKKIFNTSGR